MNLNTVEELIQDIRLGKMVILMDDEDRENEGDIVMAAECVRPQDINFMAMHARGLICMPMTRDRCERLGLPLMVDRNASGFGTKFTLSIEAKEGVTTGISAADRAHTVRVAAAKNATKDDIVQPGHIFPLMAESGGVLTRAGHTEAACDLARLAGFGPAGVICEIMNDDGTMARRPDLEKFAEKHDIKIGTIADLIHYRVVNEQTIHKLAVETINTDFGEFQLHSYRDDVNDDIHFAVTKGEINHETPVLVRVHLGSSIRDLLHIQLPGENSGWNMNRCLKKISEEGGAVVLLANAESSADLISSLDIARGNKPAPMGDSAQHQNTYMNVGLGSQILRDLGVGKIRLMGAPIKYNAISGFDLDIAEFVSADGEVTPAEH
ncbi:3,4-dihydroxy 2-butanone 4-phosphate synthase/GTP cyclohydrolase II [Litorivivens lipolytica]|uniref:3,4-dihydroxy-2-butanone 4-phosphate synthase n=1 Tax=Litorivivens lipolytica TaxID=1524264 RepID=A0A7W4W5M8_9GAMM|nr:bifunctional 3,4-dihydroxy-2-butanone-4-phosphate synthase/GTP cyclohydrolase II [Litorivivens lipolytica]MBB3047339.1 3,4-dihydroxy 2-butanone 4-phosphate synthase/GTP cyclohydrolase II [Litorivivens lipolytica]